MARRHLLLACTANWMWRWLTHCCAWCPVSLAGWGSRPLNVFLNDRCTARAEPSPLAAESHQRAAQLIDRSSPPEASWGAVPRRVGCCSSDRWLDGAQRIGKARLRFSDTITLFYRWNVFSIFSSNRFNSLWMRNRNSHPEMVALLFFI